MNMARKPWSAAKIARVEQQAQALGDLQNFVVRSPLFPGACVVVFYALLFLVVGGVPKLVDALLGQ